MGREVPPRPLFFALAGEGLDDPVPGLPALENAKNLARRLAPKIFLGGRAVPGAMRGDDTVRELDEGVVLPWRLLGQNV